MKEIKKVIGENIRYERKLRNMSLDDLAEILGISTGFIGLVERGRGGMEITKLLEIAKVFNISLDELATSRDEQDMKAKGTLSDPIEDKKSMVYSMTNDLTAAELECIASIIRSMKKLRFQ